YLDWFFVNRHPLNAYGGGDLGYLAWWDLPALPKLNVANPRVREFVLDVAEHWLRFGADGWRLDVPAEIDDDDFWREFRLRCRATREDAYLVGEIWDEAGRWLQGDMFDGVMNYPLARAIYGLVGRDVDTAEAAKRGLGRLERMGAAAFADRTDKLLAAYPEEATLGQLNVLDSHDTPRMGTVLRGDETAIRQALTLQFAFPGSPCLYYGDEIGLRGGHDPRNRGTVPWAEPATWAGGLRAFVSRLGARRAEVEPVRRGPAHVLDGPGGGVRRRGSG